MSKSECFEFVLNAVLYREPVEFFQNRCDMIALRIFQEKPLGVILDFLWARDLFISYICESGITVVRSRSDHGRDI